MDDTASVEYISGGYYLALRSRRTPYTSPDLIPEDILSASTCICHFFPNTWAIEWASIEPDARSEEAAAFGIKPSDLPSLIAWGTSELSKSFGWPSAFYTLESARDARARWLPDDLEVVPFGLGFHVSNVDDFLTEAKPPDQQPGYAPMGEYGIYECVSARNAIAAHGEAAGFELLATYVGLLTCSWLCNGLEKECASQLGIRPNRKGFLESHSEAMRCAQYIARDDVGAEPGLWLPWLITAYTTR